jgi:hypothetical protein
LFVRLSGEVIHIRLRELIGGWLGVLSRSVLCVVPLVATPAEPANFERFGVVVVVGVGFDGVAADFAGLKELASRAGPHRKRDARPLARGAEGRAMVPAVLALIPAVKHSFEQ